MEPAAFTGMADNDYERESNFSREDPTLTPQNRWRWLLPVVLLIVLPIAGIYALRETDGSVPGPQQEGTLRAPDTIQDRDAVGTGGRAPTLPPALGEPDAAVIREIETITGQVDANPLIGQKVDLHVPIAERANDYAFWVGEKDSRLLVVARRDRRDGQQRQQGTVADHGVAPLEAGRTAAISGSIQKLPKAEEMASWNLTDREQREAAAMGVYVRADTVTVQ